MHRCTTYIHAHGSSYMQVLKLPGYLQSVMTAIEDLADQAHINGAGPGGFKDPDMLLTYLLACLLAYLLTYLLTYLGAGPGGFNDPDMLVVGLEGMTPCVATPTPAPLALHTRAPRARSHTAVCAARSTLQPSTRAEPLNP